MLVQDRRVMLLLVVVVVVLGVLVRVLGVLLLRLRLRLRLMLILLLILLLVVEVLLLLDRGKRVGGRLGEERAAHIPVAERRIRPPVCPFVARSVLLVGLLRLLPRLLPRLRGAADLSDEGLPFVQPKS